VRGIDPVVLIDKDGTSYLTTRHVPPRRNKRERLEYALTQRGSGRIELDWIKFE
jgi:hypothetical protein